MLRRLLTSSHHSVAPCIHTRHILTVCAVKAHFHLPVQLSSAAWGHDTTTYARCSGCWTPASCCRIRIINQRPHPIKVPHHTRTRTTAGRQALIYRRLAESHAPVHKLVTDLPCCCAFLGAEQVLGRHWIIQHEDGTLEAMVKLSEDNGIVGEKQRPACLIARSRVFPCVCVFVCERGCVAWGGVCPHSRAAAARMTQGTRYLLNIILYVTGVPAVCTAGQQPIIKPGGCFQYYSVAHLTNTGQELPRGSMKGDLLVDLFDEHAAAASARVIAAVGPFPLMPPPTAAAAAS